MRTISILGSTGSIGTNTIDVVNRLGIKVSAIAANRNVKALEEQVRALKPNIVAAYSKEAASDLKVRIADTNTKVLTGMDGLCDVACEQSADMVITSLVGMIGIKPTLEAVKSGKNIGLANKETLVAAGEIVISEAKKNNVKILPVDSEHSAIFQCIECSNYPDREIKKIILTASGGPFFGKTRDEILNITPAEAVKHPNWSMGAKISIDSATLMNKGLEFIEAHYLFSVPTDRIEILVHPESIIHSMVEFCDGAVMAQLGTPDMRIPIQYAITYPKRYPSSVPSLDLAQREKLTFKKPDMKTFKLLKLCIEAIEKGGTAPCAVNAANEQAVALFLDGKIGFTELFDVVETAMSAHKITYNPSLEDIINTELQMRREVERLSLNGRVVTV